MTIRDKLLKLIEEYDRTIESLEKHAKFCPTCKQRMEPGKIMEMPMCTGLSGNGSIYSGSNPDALYSILRYDMKKGKPISLKVDEHFYEKS